MGERHDAGQHSGALGDEIVGAVPEGSLDHTLPSAKVKEGSARMGKDEIVPLPLVAGSERSYGDCGLRSVQDAMTGYGPLSSVKKSRSIRVQLKFRNRRRNRGSVRSRFR